jgi:hypothetical protein
MLIEVLAEALKQSDDAAIQRRLHDLLLSTRHSLGLHRIELSDAAAGTRLSWTEGQTMTLLSSPAGPASFVERWSLTGAAPLGGSLDLYRRERDTVLIVEHLVGRRRLAIDPDQVVLRLARGDFVAEQLLDRRAFGHVDVVGEAAAVVVDVEDTEVLHDFSR